MSNALDKIKKIAEQMPDGSEKQAAFQAYNNLKTFEIIADSFDKLIEYGSGGNVGTESGRKMTKTVFDNFQEFS